MVDKKGLKLDAKTIIILGGTIFAVWVLFFGGYGAMQNAYQPANIAGTPMPHPAASGVTAGTPEPLQFYLTDELAGGNLGTSTLTVYTNANVHQDTLTTTSGAATSGSVWTPGQTGYVTVSKVGIVPETVPFTVPSQATVGQYGTPTYYIALSDKSNGTYTIKCSDNLGNTYNNLAVINFTTLSQTSVTLSFTVFNSGSNTGWKTTFDTLNAVNQAAGIELSTAGSSVSLPSGIQGGSQANTFPRGSSTYWSTVLSDSSLTNQKVGQTQTLSGQSPFSIVINKAALSGTQNFTMTLNGPFDSSYFQTNGSGGPNTATLASFNFQVAT